jgi:uncharacterized damage-inducible protein DinB
MLRSPNWELSVGVVGTRAANPIRVSRLNERCQPATYSRAQRRSGHEPQIGARARINYPRHGELISRIVGGRTIVEMTSAKDLQALYDYCYWANGKLLEVVAKLTPEQFTHSVGGSYGSVRNTLVHVLSAEWGWLDRCGGAQRGPALAATDYPTVTALIDRWRQVEAYVREFLSNLSDQDLGRIVNFSFGSGPKYAHRLGELMHHAAIHGIHHRGQVALLLRSLGQVPGNFDMLLYCGRNQTS